MSSTATTTYTQSLRSRTIQEEDPKDKMIAELQTKVDQLEKVLARVETRLAKHQHDQYRKGNTSVEPQDVSIWWCVVIPILFPLLLIAAVRLFQWMGENGMVV